VWEREKRWLNTVQYRAARRGLQQSADPFYFALFFRYSLLYITKVKKKKLLRRGLGRPSFQCRGRIWIDGIEGTFLGYGRIVLLERIRAYGSISQAAKSMEMSYRHAWELVESMNRQAARPLVKAITGGRGGGGAQLTEEGERAVTLFRGLYADFQDFLNKEETALGFPESKRTRRRKEG